MNLTCKCFRRFGVELETNTSNGFIIRPNSANREIPVGADHVAIIIERAIQEPVKIYGWEYFHNNMEWVVKPDNSCGIEVNTPILKGWMGLAKLLRVIDGLKKGGIKSDDRCSFHIHVDISDLSKTQLASVIAWWIKCEHVFFDSIPSNRKTNRYCRLIGFGEIEHDAYLTPDDIIQMVSMSKYQSINAYHFMKGGGFSSENCRRKTLEFRIMEGNACLDSYMAKNWVRLVLHFVEMAKSHGFPRPYTQDNPWTALLWLDAKDVFSFLKFDRTLSEGLSQVRGWFLDRLAKNYGNTGLPGVWSDEARSVSQKHIRELIGCIPSIPLESIEEATYGDKYII